MDSLANLPPKDDTVKTPEEIAVMQQFFPETQVSEPKKGLNWKLIGYSSVIFVILANPWVDQIFCKIPYCGENSIMLLLLKLMIFLLLIVVVSLYV